MDINKEEGLIISEFKTDEWTNDDVEKWEELWTRYGDVVNSSNEIIEKINEANKINESYKSELKSSSDRCNEIIAKEYFISVESSKEIVELSKNMRKVRKQEDELESELAGYESELKKLKEIEKQIIDEINELCIKVQGVTEPEKLDVDGTITINDVSTIQNIEIDSIDIKQNEIISTKKTALGILKSYYDSSVSKIVEISEVVKEKINNSDFIYSIKNITSEVQKSREELKNRIENRLAAEEAVRLATETTKKLKNVAPSFDINYINEEKNEDEVKDLSMEESEEKNQVAEAINTETIENVDNNELKTEDSNVLLNNNETSNVQVPTKEESILKSNNDPEEVRNINLQDLNEVKENIVTPIQEEKVNPINLGEISELPTQNESINTSLEEKVEPINFDNLSNINEQTAINTIKESSNEKINSKINNIASSKGDRINNINKNFSKVNVLNETGISKVDKSGSIMVYNLSPTLKSVQAFNDYKLKNNSSSNEEEVKDVSDIFGNNNLMSMSM